MRACRPVLVTPGGGGGGAEAEVTRILLQVGVPARLVAAGTVLRAFNTIHSCTVQMGAGALPALPPPLSTGCRADTQIACPGTAHRICNVQRCDGTEDCPR